MLLVTMGSEIHARQLHSAIKHKLLFVKLYCFKYSKQDKISHQIRLNDEILILRDILNKHRPNLIKLIDIFYD